MNGHGGSRSGAGRKPKLLTQLLLDTETAGEDIAAAYRLFKDTMGNPAVDLPVRLDAAREVLNRLCGKPAQAVQVSGPDGDPIEVTATVRTAAAAELDQWRRAMTQALPTEPPGATT